MPSKLFTIEEARALMPSLRELLREANQDLFDQAERVRTAAEQFQKAEDELGKDQSVNDDEALRARRKCFEESIERLANAQQDYITRFNYWVENITSLGVILRDLREGLLDFPAIENGFAYLLCWRMDESDIRFWHLETDGFMGRKPLAALLEYC